MICRYDFDTKLMRFSIYDSMPKFTVPWANSYQNRIDKFYQNPMELVSKWYDFDTICRYDFDTIFDTNFDTILGWKFNSQSHEQNRIKIVSTNRQILDTNLIYALCVRDLSRIGLWVVSTPRAYWGFSGPIGESLSCRWYVPVDAKMWS